MKPHLACPARCRIRHDLPRDDPAETSMVAALAWWVADRDAGLSFQTVRG